jgi:YHS domain-containing protein
MTPSKLLSGLLLFAALLALAFAAFGGGPKDPVFQKRGAALAGYDAVAYFTDGAAVKGSEEHTFEWNGATWRFASAEHRDLFAADPERYAPQYGGYCAWAVSQGKTAPVDPERFDVVDGKLYLNYNQKIQKRWREDRDALIVAADENWPGLIEE